jgi:hypothetical protein
MHNRARMLLILGVASTLAALAGPLAWADEAAGEARETVLDLRINHELLLAYLEDTPDFEAPAEWASMRSFSKNFPKIIRERLVTRDGWGNDLQVGSFHGQLIVVSPGPNGTAETVEQLSAQAEQDEQSLSFDDPTQDDIVLLVGDRVINGPKSITELLLTLMADLRSIGTAVETYSIDLNTYPAQTNGLQSVEFISPDLTPIYLRTLPIKDPWGNEILYWSDRTQYVIVSMGADGVLDRPYEIKPDWLDSGEFRGGYSEPDTDMVFANGQFVQWPYWPGR